VYCEPSGNVSPSPTVPAVGAGLAGGGQASVPARAARDGRRDGRLGDEPLQQFPHGARLHPRQRRGPVSAFSRTSAPAATSTSIMLVDSLRTAQCSGVTPSVAFALTLAPR